MGLLRSVLAASAGLALAVSLPMSASAATTVGGGGGGSGGGGGGSSPCLGSTGTLSFSQTRLYPGVDVTATWTTSRPAGCEGVESELTGPGGVAVFGGAGGTATFLPPTLGTFTYSVTVFYPAGSVVVATASLLVSQTPHTPAVAFATPTGAVDEANDNTSGVVPVPGLTAAAGTSPVVVSDLDFDTRQIAAHQAGTDTLGYVDFLGQVVDTGVTMAAGSSPAISAIGRGDAEIAFAGSDTFLRMVDVGTGVVSFVRQATGVSPGTNPAIVGGTIAFHTNGEDTLWYIDENGNPHDTGLKMAAGSSPAIATGLPDTVILFVRDTGFPAVYDISTQTVTDYPAEAVAPNTGLAIRVIFNSNCGYEFTFVGADDHALWREFSCSASAPAASTHIPVAVGTGPSMAALSSTFPSGFQVLVNNPATGTIWQYFGDGNQTDTRVPIEAGTTPSISNATDSPSTATLFNTP